MKKLFFLLLATAVLASCDGPAGPPGPGMNWNVEYFTVQPEEWKLMTNSDNPNEVYYQCNKSFQNIKDRELRTFIYDNGTTSVSLYFNYDTPDETQTPLPFVLNLNDPFNRPYTETWYYDYTPSNIAFFVAYSGNVQSKPGYAVFRVAMNW